MLQRRIVIALAIAGIAIGVYLRFSHGSTDTPHGTPALLLSASDTPSVVPSAFLTTCNGWVIGDLLFTASHCLEESRGYVLNPHDACATALDVSPLDGLQVISEQNDLTVLGDAKSSEGVKAPAGGGPLGVGATVSVIGFGRRGGSGTTACHLQNIEAIIVDRSACQGVVDDSMQLERVLCISGPSLCRGFSGSAVVNGGALVAVVSRGTSCSESHGVVAAPLTGQPSTEEQ